MPRGNGTGPRGTGQGTGRGMGNCSGGLRRGMGIALGLGVGLGLKRGFRNLMKNQNPENELAELKAKESMLEEGLSKIKERISELEREK